MGALEDGYEGIGYRVLAGARGRHSAVPLASSVVRNPSMTFKSRSPVPVPSYLIPYPIPNTQYPSATSCDSLRRACESRR